MDVKSFHVSWAYCGVHLNMEKRLLPSVNTKYETVLGAKDLFSERCP
jgi:hypothetical protein